MPETKRMNKEIKVKWLSVLRSGKYKQTQSHLRKKIETGIGYCCLGLLCNIKNRNKWIPVGINSIYKFDKSYGTLPDSVMEWSRLESDSVMIYDIVDRQGNYLNLAVLNDDGFTFMQIADVIDYFL